MKNNLCESPITCTPAAAAVQPVKATLETAKHTPGPWEVYYNRNYDRYQLRLME